MLVDGRSVYTPLYSGVEWDGQHVQLEDLERIEVISGPGGALWGANAVNGVVNVISRSARDTQGLLATAHLGSVGSAGQPAHTAAPWDRRAPTASSSRASAGPHPDRRGAGRQRQVRRRAGRLPHRLRSRRQRLHIQGDAFDAPMDDLLVRNERLRGDNLLGRWRRQVAGGGAEVQAYYDQENRVTRGVFEATETWDIEGRFTRTLGRHQFVAGRRPTGPPRTISSTASTPPCWIPSAPR